MLEVALGTAARGGVQRVRLADHRVALAPGVAYRWYVGVVIDPMRRSKDVLAGGMVERVLLTEDVRQALAGVPQRKLPHRYAEAGLWYDALAASADLVNAAPDDAALRRLHADLLAQVGLGHVAP